MRYGFFGQRGLTEFLNQDGEGICFSLFDQGKWWNRFFLNIGQPCQTPTRHPMHKDDPTVNDKVRLGACCFEPFYADYTLADNCHFEWAAREGVICLEAVVDKDIRFDAVGQLTREAGSFRAGSNFYFSGIEPGRIYQGKVTLAVSSRPLPEAVNYTQSSRVSITAADSVRQAAQAAVFYNLAVSKRLRHVFFVPVNKTWISFLSGLFRIDDFSEGPLIFGWDTAFASIILAEFDLELAKSNLLSLLEGITADGRVPQLRIGDHISNRTNPPIWFLAARVIFDKSADIGFLEEIYPLIRSNYYWFKRNRQNSDFSYSWGSDNEEHPELMLITGKAGAVLESGMDDSPLFDNMVFARGKLDHACIDLSCLLYSACENLIYFAQLLGSEASEDIDPLRQDLVAYQKSIDKFFCRKRTVVNSFPQSRSDKLFPAVLTPVSFYPLLTSLLQQQQVDLLKEIFKSKHFTGTHLLPSLSFTDPAYTGDGDYWRGRIWPPQVYLTAKGFQRYDQRIYQQIKELAAELLLNEWKRHRHVHENYSSVTGEGEPQPGVYARSCPLYSWGGLLGVI